MTIKQIVTFTSKKENIFILF